jgi:hypothetical protein
MKNYGMAKLSLLLVALLIICSPDAMAQRKKKRKKGKGKTAKTAAKKKKRKATIASKIKKSKAYKGLFTIYQDTVTGKLQMLIKEDQIGKEFIYFNQIKDGVVDAFAFRGSYDGATVFTIKKYFNRLEFVALNNSFYFDPKNALSRSADANVSNSVVASAKIVASDKKAKQYLIPADKLFLSESLRMISIPNFPGMPRGMFRLGRLNRAKSKVLAIRSYPANSDLAIEYVFSNPKPINGGSRAVTDARNVSIKVYHSLIEMPKNDYKVRYDDPRVGYFATQVNDMTSKATTPYRDMIHRWHLKKKDPNAALSEPVEPIVWWIENSTPVEFRESIKQGVLEWNKAFEKAGFKNAMVVKVQPDDAKWDAGDIRYNVLRWTSSPNPPFGGYGPSFVNPRTGQILGADIMLEFVHHTNRVIYERIFDPNAQAKADALQQMWAKHKKDYAYCNFGDMMHQNHLFGRTALNVLGGSTQEMEGMQKQGMIELIMHEVGHTLGLNHNMKSSQLWTPAQLKDKNLIKGKALTGSVMDYALIHVTKNKAQQGQYHSSTVGPYDKWAIEFGYKPNMSAEERAKILARSTEPKLIFGNDADDMRSPGKAIDPRVNVGDMSSDQITYSKERLELVNDLMKGLKAQVTKKNKGKSYQQLLQSYWILTRQKGGAANVVSRYIGGVYVDRAMIGQAGGTKPYTPVSLADQKRAMKLLADHTFAPKAFDAPKDLYNYLAPQRRGYNFFSRTEDPKLHSMVLSMQRNVLRHLLHYNTLQRIVDSELYGNKYTLSQMMTDLNDAVFKADLNQNVNTFRQNLQVEYTKMLINALTGRASRRYSNTVKSMVLYSLEQIKRKATAGVGNTSTRAHRNHLKFLINKALSNK